MTAYPKAFSPRPGTAKRSAGRGTQTSLPSPRLRGDGPGVRGFGLRFKRHPTQQEATSQFVNAL
jgi:hypothetical protein